MRNLLVLVLVSFASGEALATVTPSAAPPALETAADADLVARRKKRKKKRRKKKRTKRRKKRASKPPPAAETETEATPAASGAGDWASPGWTTTETGSSPSGTVVEEKGETETAPTERDQGLAGAFVIAEGAYAGSGRSFTIDGNTTANVRPYQARFVSMVGGRLETYPAMFFDVPALVERIGVRGSYWQAVGLESATETNQEERYPTTWNELDVGLTFRFGLGDTLWVAGLSYGMLNFSLNVPSSDAVAEQSHDLGYHYLRVGIDFRYPFGALALLLGGGYRQVFSTGELGSTTFPDSSALGFDAHAGVAYQVFSFLEVRFIASFNGFLHSLESNATYAGDAASDFYWAGETSVVVFF